MKKQHQKTLEAIFRRPVSAGIEYRDFVSLMLALGATVKEAEGSRQRVSLRGEIRVMHRPHPRSTMDKGAVSQVREWLESMGIKP